MAFENIPFSQVLEATSWVSTLVLVLLFDQLVKPVEFNEKAKRFISKDGGFSSFLTSFVLLILWGALIYFIVEPFIRSLIAELLQQNTQNIWQVGLVLLVLFFIFKKVHLK